MDFNFFINRDFWLNFKQINSTKKRKQKKQDFLINFDAFKVLYFKSKKLV